MSEDAPPAGGSSQPSPQPTPEPTPTPPGSSVAALAGYWRGGASDEHDGDALRDATAFIDVQGDMHLVVDGEDGSDFLVYGNVCCATDVDEKVAGARYLKDGSDSADFTASFKDGRLTGVFEFRERTYHFSVTPDGAYHQSLALQHLAGVYTRTFSQQFGSPLTLSVAIDATGRVSGSYSNGCVLDGSASIADASRNMVRFDLQIENCGTQASSSRRWNGHYSGLGVLLRNAPAPDGLREDTLLFSLVGPTWLGLISIGK
ncbi:MAG TPA: hypothetical protein VHK24_02250 [Steroidobacter sp.]|nr:hypothetical protein [Steroidobacter sp.]